jgi:hypothetical protein
MAAVSGVVQVRVPGRSQGDGPAGDLLGVMIVAAGGRQQAGAWRHSQPGGS